MPRSHLLSIVAVSVAGALWYATATLWGTGRLWSPLDDAFIYAQYARQLAAGHLYEYHPGDGVSTGVTSPLYPLLLVPFHWVGLGTPDRMVWVWFALGILWRVWAGVLLYMRVREWTRHAGAALAAALLALLSRSFNWGVSSGMEIGMVCVVLLGSLGAARRWALLADAPAGCREERRARWCWIAWLGALSVARPECTFSAGLAWLVLGGFAWRRARRPHHPSDCIAGAAGRDVLLRWLATTLGFAPLLAWLAFIFASTGTLQTNVSVIKTVAGLPGLGVKGALLAWFFSIRVMLDVDLVSISGLPAIGWTLAALGVGAMLWRRRIALPSAPPDRARGAFVLRHPAHWLPLVWLAGLAVPALSFAPFVHEARYEAAHMPLYVALSVYGAWRVGVVAPRARTMVFGGLLVLIAPILLAATVVGGRRFAQGCEDMWNLDRAAAVWVRDNTRPADLIGLTDAGILPYVADRRTLDLVGLTNPVLVNALAEGQGVVWHELGALAPERRPDWIVTFPSWFAGASLGRTAAEFRTGETVVAVEKQLFITVFEPPLPGLEARLPALARVAGTTETLALATPVKSWIVRDHVNVGDLATERARGYRIENQAQWGRNTWGPLAVGAEAPGSLTVIADGGRTYSAAEEFDLVGIDPRAPLRIVVRSGTEALHRLRVHVPGREARILTVEPPSAAAATAAAAAASAGTPANSTAIAPAASSAPAGAVGPGPESTFAINYVDIEPGAAAEAATSPRARVRMELVRDGTPGDATAHTTFAVWALQPADDGETTTTAPLERAIAERIRAESRAWARKQHHRSPGVIPVNSRDPQLFPPGRGWSAPQRDARGVESRWGLMPESTLGIPMPETSATRVLEVRAAAFPADSRTTSTILNTVRVYHGGAHLATWELGRAEQTYRAEIPGSESDSGLGTIRFAYARGTVATKPDRSTPGGLPLAVRFKEIRLVRKEPSPGSE